MDTGDSDKVSGQDEDARLTSLEEQLKAAHHIEAERNEPIGSAAAFSGKGASQGNRVLSTLIGVPLGATVIGWLLDRWFGSAPKVMLVMLVIGIIAAFVQIYRIAQERAE